MFRHYITKGFFLKKKKKKKKEVLSRQQFVLVNFKQTLL